MKYGRLLGMALPAVLAVVAVTAAFPDRALTAPNLLYDVDFGSPPHTVGLPPVAGAGAGAPPRDTLSSINFGTPTVVASFGPLTDQPLEFDSFDGQGDQIQLRLSNLPARSSYTIEADLVIAALDDFAGPFTVHLDAPQIRTVRFRADGTVTHSAPGSRGTIGSFTFGSEIHLRIEVDLAADSWQIFLDSVLVHTGGFGGATAIRTVRFTTGVLSPPAGARAAVDNIRIFSSGPPLTPTATRTPTVTPTPCPTGKVPAGGGCGTATPTPTPCPTGKVPAETGCGTATATPTPDPRAGAMEVDCDASAAGVQSDCSYPPGASFQVEVHVTLAPASGYFFFQAKLAWTEGVVNYLPTARASDDVLWPPCGFAARFNNLEAHGVPSVLSGCTPSTTLRVGDTFTGAILTYEFQCKSAPDAVSPAAGLAPNQSVLDLVSSVNEPPPKQGGTFFGDVNLQSIYPGLTGATVICAELTPTPTPRDAATLTRSSSTPVPPTPIGAVASFDAPSGGGTDAGAAVLAWLEAEAAAGGAPSGDAGSAGGVPGPASLAGGAAAGGAPAGGGTDARGTAGPAWLVAGAAAGALALGGAAWYARRRRASLR